MLPRGVQGENPAADAEAVLRSVGYRGAEDLPIDATRVAELFDANVFWDDLSFDSELDGFVVVRPNGSANITVNAHHGINRRRFTIAHEFGHAIRTRAKDRLDGGEAFGFVDDRDTISEDREFHRDGLATQGTDPEERYANGFAASLLMPAQEVRSFHRENYSAREMARIFRVSESAMIFRLKNLGLVID